MSARIITQVGQIDERSIWVALDSTCEIVLLSVNDPSKFSAGLLALLGEVKCERRRELVLKGRLLISYYGCNLGG